MNGNKYIKKSRSQNKILTQLLIIDEGVDDTQGHIWMKTLSIIKIKGVLLGDLGANRKWWLMHLGFWGGKKKNPRREEIKERC